MAKNSYNPKHRPTNAMLREMREDALLLTHCYNLEIVFPEGMKRVRKEIMAEFKERGFEEAHIRQLEAQAVRMSYWGEYQFVKVYPIMKSMAEMMGRDLKSYKVDGYPMADPWRLK